jgi:O-antigen ligase
LAGGIGVRAVDRARGIEPGVVLLVAGLALACYLQGAFFPRAQALIAVPLVVGALLAPRLPTLTRPDLPVVLTAAGLAVWAVADGALIGHLAAGFRYFLLIAGVLGLAGVCRQLPGTARGTMVNGLLAIGCAVAALGWFGVVVHNTTWGFLSAGQWRASSTLTYPNATAAVLAMAALVCLALRTTDPTARRLGGAATILVTGLVATLSRAGLGGLGIGLVLLGFGLGWRLLWRAAVGPLLGALVATIGLLPSITAPTPTVVTIVVAVLAAVIGSVIGSRVAAGRLVLVIVVAGMAAAPVLLAARLASRFTFDSPDRWGSFRAAWELFLRHPVTGAGPGIDQLVLARATGGTSVFRYAHNEYLQVLAELGVPGVVLLVAFLALVMRRLWRGRADTGALAVGGLAALAALALHAGFDFVWHIPAVPLLAAAFVGVAMPQTGPTTTETKGQLHPQQK